MASAGCVPRRDGVKQRGQAVSLSYPHSTSSGSSHLSDDNTAVLSVTAVTF